MKKNKRAATVFIGLTTALTLTAGLLLVVSPQPLKPDGTTMLAIEGNAGEVPAGRWQYIYVHHSKSPTAVGEGDHFVVGADGSVRQTLRWKRQLPPGPPVAGARMNSACVSIQLVGDLDETAPTPAQLTSVTQLVGGLQRNYKIPASGVLLAAQRHSPAGYGQHFPVAEFQASLLP